MHIIGDLSANVLWEMDPIQKTPSSVKGSSGESTLRFMSEPTRTRRGLETIQVCPGVHLEYLRLCPSSPRCVRLKAGRLSLFRLKVTNNVVV